MVCPLLLNYLNPSFTIRTVVLNQKLGENNLLDKDVTSLSNFNGLLGLRRVRMWRDNRQLCVKMKFDKSSPVFDVTPAPFKGLNALIFQ